jgi:hypothetical protein
VELLWGRGIRDRLGLLLLQAEAAVGWVRFGTVSSSTGSGGVAGDRASGDSGGGEGLDNSSDGGGTSSDSPLASSDPSAPLPPGLGGSCHWIQFVKMTRIDADGSLADGDFSATGTYK